MRKMFLKLSLVFILIVSFTACNKDEEIDQKKSEVVANEFFAKFGIVNRKSDVKINLESFNKNNNLTKKDFDLSNAREVFYYEGGDKAYIFESKSNSNQKYVVKVNSKNDLLSEKNIILTNVKDISNFTTTFNDENNKIVTVIIANGIAQSGTSANLTKKRQAGESFGKCFTRTFNEFFDDAISILAGIVFPYSIAAAVAISCA